MDAIHNHQKYISYVMIMVFFHSIYSQHNILIMGKIVIYKRHGILGLVYTILIMDALFEEN